MLIDKDKLFSVDYKKATQAAFLFIESMQKQRPELQVAAIMMTFSLLCTKYNLQPTEVLTMTDNMLAEGYRKEDPDLMTIVHYFDNFIHQKLLEKSGLI